MKILFCLFTFLSICSTLFSATTNIRSIGKNAESLIGGSDGAGATTSQLTVTFNNSITLPENVGEGDRLILDVNGDGSGRETVFILSRDDDRQVTLQNAPKNGHISQDFQIERAYNTMQAWEDARGGDLVGGRRIEKGICYNDGVLTQGVVIDGSITNSEYYLFLTVASKNRHSGVARVNGVYAGVAIVLQNGREKAFYIKDCGTKVEGFIIDCNNQYESKAFSIYSTGSYTDAVVIDGCIFFNNKGSSTSSLVNMESAFVKMSNCIGYDSKNSSIVSANYRGIFHISNCTFLNANETSVMLIM